MNRLFLDTSVLIALLKGNLASSEEIVLAVERRIAYFNGIVLTELYSGVKRKHTNKQIVKIVNALGYLRLTYEDYRDTGELRGRLISQGLTMSTPDALIATHALKHDLRLLTLDAFFMKLPVEIGLQIEIPS